MSKTTVHVAGEPQGEIQVCTRCGKVLTDNRRTMVVAGTPDGPSPTKLLWWPVGESVEVSDPNGTYAGLTDDPPTCNLERRVTDREREARILQLAGKAAGGR